MASKKAGSISICWNQIIEWILSINYCILSPGVPSWRGFHVGLHRAVFDCAIWWQYYQQPTGNCGWGEGRKKNEFPWAGSDIEHRASFEYTTRVSFGENSKLFFLFWETGFSDSEYKIDLVLWQRQWCDDKVYKINIFWKIFKRLKKFSC